MEQMFFNQSYSCSSVAESLQSLPLWSRRLRQLKLSHQRKFFFFFFFKVLIAHC